MNSLKSYVACFSWFVALALSFTASLAAESHKSHRRCSIECSECSSHPCKKVCNAGAYVQEGCVFVPDRVETVTDPTSCLPVQVTVPGANLYYRQQGEGCRNSPTIVFIPPLLGTSDAWRCQQAEFSKCFRTIAVDLRGTGRSEATDPESIQYTHQLFANDIYAMLQDPSINVTGKVILVGNALGGSIGLVYATSYPSQVAKLVMVNSGPGLYVVNDCAVDPSCDPTIPCTTGGSCCDLNNCQSTCWPYPSFTNSQLEENFDIIGCSFEYCYGTCGDCPSCEFQPLINYFSWLIPLSIFNEPCQPALANVQAQAVQAAVQVALNDVYENILYYAMSQDLRPYLSSVRVPTLICIGTIDQLVPNGAGLYLNKHIKHSRLVQFQGKGNEPQVTAYKQFNKVLDRFIQSKDFPCFTNIPDKGCCICPLIVPEPFIPCSVP